MLKKSLKFLKIVAIAVSISVLAACAAPATKGVPISQAEVQHEIKMQNELAKNHKPKKITRKYKNLSQYQAELERVGKPLAAAAKKICINGSSCAYKYKVIEHRSYNAFTDGKDVIFTTQMMDFLEGDKELATVISHELSHNIMGHQSKIQQNAIVGVVFDIAAAAGGVNTGGIFSAIGGRSYSQAFENEADYVSIYVMANAGYDISNMHQIWRKFTIQTGTLGDQYSFLASHPSHPERYIRIKRAVEEVNAKKKAGKKLIPNYKV